MDFKTPAIQDNSSSNSSRGDESLAFLNAMREKAADLLGKLDTENECDLSAVGKEISSVSGPSRSSKEAGAGNGPPPGLTPDEELLWWKQRIADLSAPVQVGDEGLPRSDSKAESKAFQNLGFKSSSTKSEK